MSTISAVPTSAPRPVDTQRVIARQSANYQPNIWGDFFLGYSSSSESSQNLLEAKDRIEKLVAEVKEMFNVVRHKPSQLMNLIDQVQRLGLGYKFENEIEIGVQQIYKSFLDFKDNHNEDLHSISLLFRLLRQQGYKIPCDIFNKFTDDKGKFNESLATDVQGLLGLYEAGHFRIHGEDILDEALSFTITHLKLLDKQQANSCLAKQVTHALSQSLRYGMTRLEARHYMMIYQEDPLHDQTLLSLAKLDFNLLQKQHQRELSDITRWWKNLDFTQKLPFARDRLVECYFWILGVFYEPKYAFAREFATKVIILTSVMDDIYDVYGTMEELEMLTQAIERWDIKAIPDLPEYMQPFYRALLDVYYDIEDKLAQQGNSYRLYYAKEAMKRQAQGYYLEAKWFDRIPTMEEYLSIALLTSGYGLMANTCFVGMGDVATKDAFEWLLHNPKIVNASTIIARLMDDIVSHKREQDRQHVASAVQCYMKQYEVSEEIAENELRKQITNAWKDINEECLRPTKMPMTLLTRIVNLACVMDVLYKDGDNYTNPGKAVKGFVTSLLVQPVDTNR